METEKILSVRLIRVFSCPPPGATPKLQLRLVGPRGMRMAKDDAADLMAQWRQGDQQAAAVLFQRYSGRLIELVRRRLSNRLNQRFDPEDVVQSAYRSFFAHARDGEYHSQ